MQSFSTNLGPGYYRAVLSSSLSDIGENPLSGAYTWFARVYDVSTDTDNDGVPGDIEPWIRQLNVGFLCECFGGKRLQKNAGAPAGCVEAFL